MGLCLGKFVLAIGILQAYTFTGSTGVFNYMWKAIGENMGNCRSYPRIVGETGGKDFAMVHKSADSDVVATALARGAFEFQGQNVLQHQERIFLRTSPAR